MANLILAIIILSIFLLLIAETVTVRLTHNGETVIKFDFILFQFLLYPSRKHTKPKKRRSGLLQSFKKKLANAGAMKKAFDFFLGHSLITVHEINLPINTSDPAKFALLSQNASTLILMLLTYLSLKTETLNSEDYSFVTNELNTTTLDVTLKTGLYTIIISALLFYIERKKIKRKQRQRFVGNKNE